MKSPDFFIVGAPKCGTTALYDYLQQHPQIWLPQKELYYFGSDFTFRHPRPTEAYYRSLFADSPDRATCLGEASVWYLYAQNAAAEIKRFNPNAKIIVLLRRPDDMLYSLHSQQLYAGNEYIVDFAQALAAEPDRRKGRLLPPHIGCPYEALYYSQVARYAPQLQRYFDAFGREGVLTILFDDLASNPAAVYRQTLQFLGVPQHELPQFKQINPNKTVRSPLWRDLLKQRPAWLVRAAQILLPSRRLRQGIVSRLWAMNTRYTPRPPLPAPLRQQLIDQFADDINQLSALLQRDLSAWQYPPPPKAQNS